MSNTELKNNIKKQCRDAYEMGSAIQKTLKKDNPKYKTLHTLQTYFFATSYYHSSTLSILCGIKNKYPLEERIASRRAHMEKIMECMESLVAEGLFTENEYLVKCNEFKDDLEMLTPDT